MTKGARREIVKCEKLIKLYCAICHRCQDIADYILQALPILCRQRAFFFLALPLPCVHDQRYDLCDLSLIEKSRCRTLAPVILDLKQQLGHRRKVRRLIDALKGGGKIEIKLGVLLLQEILVIGRQNFHTDGMNGDPLVDERTIPLFVISYIKKQTIT